jgi:hypothetical protein
MAEAFKNKYPFIERPCRGDRRKRHISADDPGDERRCLKPTDSRKQNYANSCAVDSPRTLGDGLVIIRCNLMQFICQQ